MNAIWWNSEAQRPMTPQEIEALLNGYARLPRGAAIVTNGWEYSAVNTGKVPTISTGDFIYGAVR